MARLCGVLAQDNKHDNYFREGLLINDKDLSGKPGSNKVVVE
ncbi:hypothetical protein SPHINGO8BC_60188 [Sphingobacterium multivorum]|uniref:Uncharacterized protein n=1 Tax=Sphingobacterium multivorum TaxID=28454 RepID=A0A654DGD4_SPHMU|nr:hypothetical protein SPHINGO8BC_60188 [Sphingobacterium multivorum]